MGIHLLKQTRQNNCGQTCVAMISGRTIKQVEKVYGRGSTNWEMDKLHLPRLGFKLGAFVDLKGRINPVINLPKLALIRICRFAKSGKVFETSGHAIVHYDGLFYDPQPMTYKVIPPIFKIAEYLEIIGEPIEPWYIPSQVIT